MSPGWGSEGKRLKEWIVLVLAAWGKEFRWEANVSLSGPDSLGSVLEVAESVARWLGQGHLLPKRSTLLGIPNIMTSRKRLCYFLCLAHAVPGPLASLI